jgi:hypothetical protein
MRNETPLPTRVIDVGPKTVVNLDDVGSVPADQDDVRLIEPGGEHGRYVASSHCWGQLLSFTTTKETYSTRKQCMSLREIPETFRDAILMTRKLDVQYLWIDSLCIIQDDNGD